MVDDKTKKDAQDSARISLEEDYEVRYWTKELNVTPDQLKAAVQKAGPLVEDVKKYLKK